MRRKEVVEFIGVPFQKRFYHLYQCIIIYIIYFNFEHHVNKYKIAKNILTGEGMYDKLFI